MTAYRRAGAAALATALLHAGPTTAQDPSDPAIQLLTAETLQCEFNGMEGVITFDIDRAAGTARLIGNNGASDVVPAYAIDAVSFIERTPAGYIILTTVFAERPKPRPSRRGHPARATTAVVPASRIRGGDVTTPVNLRDDSHFSIVRVVLAVGVEPHREPPSGRSGTRGAMKIPLRRNAPGGLRFKNFDPQTTRQLLHVAYARMYRHNMVARGVDRSAAWRKGMKQLRELDAGEKSIVEFSSTAAERRKRNANCVYCSAHGSDTDHLIPRLRGGPEDADNHGPACRSCNSSKGSKDVFTWAESKGFFPLEIGKRYIRLAWLWSSRMDLLDAPLDELRAANPPFLLDIPWTDDLPTRRPNESDASSPKTLRSPQLPGLERLNRPNN